MESTKTSVVWNFFQSETHSGKYIARCLKCSTVLQCKNKSTSALHRHLKSKHGNDEDVLNYSQNKRQCVGLQAEPVEPRPSSSMSAASFSPFVVKEEPYEETKDEIIARLAAVDGVSFYAIANSKFLKASLAKEGIVVPTDPNSITKLVYEQYIISKEIVRMELSNLLLNKERFSISLEDYIPRENRCYISITLHSREEYWNLGMVRMRTDGRRNTKNIVELVKDKLLEFNVELNTNIVACVTDGETITPAFADLSGIEHQLCHVRGFHLAVCDTLYESYNQNVSDSGAMDNYDGSDDKDSSIEETEHAINAIPGFNYKVTNVQFNDHVGVLVRKVRRIIRILFQIKDDVLKRYMQKKLMLDNPSRWWTLVDMLASFYEAKNAVTEVLNVIKEKIDISCEEFSQIHDIVSSLKPIKVAIERLSRGHSTLLMADAALKFINLELSEQNTQFANNMKVSVIKVFSERRNSNLVGLLKYLNNPGGYRKQSGVTLPERNALPTVAKQLLQRLYNQSTTEDPFLDIKYTPPSVMTDDSSDSTTTLNEKINALIELETIHTSSTVSLSTSEYLAQEMHFYETTNFKTDNIKQLYDALLSIPSTTLDVEGGLVDDGIFTSKYATDTTIDRIWFLKHFFLKKDKNSHMI